MVANRNSEIPVSVVTSAPCARKFGSNAYNASAITAARSPNSLRATTKISPPSKNASSEAAMCARNSSRSRSFRATNCQPEKYASVPNNRPCNVGSHKCIPSNGAAASIFTSGGTSGFSP